MSTEIQTPPTEQKPETAKMALVPPKQAINFGSAGVKLTTLEDAFRFSTAVVKSGLAPKGFTTAEAVMIALQHGAEIGLPPMAALQSIAVINGRPGIFGDAALALVRGSGLCSYHGEAETTDATDPLFRELQFAMFEKDLARAKVLSKTFSEAQTKQKDSAEDFGVTIATAREGGLLEFERFTIADAKKAGLWGKEGPWRQYPKRMLKFRARGFKLRDVYGDVLKGLRTIEELQDIPPEKNVTPTQSLAGLIGAPEPEGATLTEAGKIEKPAGEKEKAPEQPPTDVKSYTPEQRAKILGDVQAAMLDGSVSEAKVMLYAHSQKWAKEGQDEVGTLGTDVLEKLKPIIPTLSGGKVSDAKK